MQTTRRCLYILILSLMVSGGLAFSPGKCLATCEMGARPTTHASRHACCTAKATCACEAPAPRAAQHGSGHGAFSGGCTCAVTPEPANSAPSVAPLRLYVVEALPVRAGPAFTTPAVTVPHPTIAAAPIAPARYLPPSPPRAPPF